MHFSLSSIILAPVNARRVRKGQADPPAETRRDRQAPHKETHERLHGVGEGRAPQDPQSVPRHAQLQHIKDPGSAVESHVQCGETAVL